MDTKRIVTAVAVGLALIVLYMSLIAWLDKKIPGWGQQQQQTSASTNSTTAPTQPGTAPATAQASATSVPASAPTISAAAPSAQVVPLVSQPAAPVSLGSAKPDDGTYVLQLNTEPTGAGIGSVVLNGFKKAARSEERYSFQDASARRLDTAALASRSISVDNATYDLNAIQWSRSDERRDVNSAEYTVELVRDGKPLLTIRKKYQVFQRSSPSEGYEIQVEYQFVNRTDKPLTIKTAFNGPTLPPGETNRSGDRQLVGGYQTDKNSIDVVVHGIEDLKPDSEHDHIDLTRDKNRPAVWAGAESNYFGAIVLPLPMKGGSGKADYIASITAHGVDIDADIPIDQRKAYLTFETTDIRLESGAGNSVTLPLSIFLGPKWRKVLDASYYQQYPREYYLLLIIRGGMCGFCTWDWLVGLIVSLLSVFHWAFHDWGLSIIGLVALVRILLHPITRMSQISMSKMSKLGPEMERLKKKYGDDKEALNKAMIEFHRQQGIGPYIGCLPMFLQMPIWIALYGVLQTTFELRQAPFLWNFTWIHDLSQPDQLIALPHAIPFLFGYQIAAINLLPVLLAAVMFIQQQFMPKPVAATEQQMQQQKMMQWLSPAMFLLIFYSYPSGLNLYIFASTGVGIVESKIVRDHLKAREEAEKAGRVFVETKPTRGSKRGKNEPPQQPARRGLIGRISELWGKLLVHAENVRQDQERSGKKKA